MGLISESECSSKGTAEIAMTKMCEEVISLSYRNRFLVIAVLCIPFVAYSVFETVRRLNLGYWLQLAWETFFDKVPLIRVDGEDGYAASNPTAPPVVSSSNGSLELQDPCRPGFIQCYDPSTRQYLGEVPAMTEADVGLLCQKASKAQKSWQKSTFRQRRQVLRTIQKYVVRHQDELAYLSCQDSGKPMVDAILGEILTTTEKIRTILNWGEIWLRPSADDRPTGPLMMHKVATVEYIPFGVIATIAPWNYPFHNAMNHIISGIFAGNAVVTKVSEHTSWCAGSIIRMVRAALVAHGHDPDLVQTVTGFGSAGAALVANPFVDKVVFTGSPAVGKKVMETASHHLKPVILELGGKDCMVIMDDCKLEAVLPWVMRGCFQNCGQNCVGSERIMVYESVYERFVSAVKRRVESLRQGPPLDTVLRCAADVDCGSMVTDFQMGHIQSLIDDAVKMGAKVLCGGRRNVKLSGQFYEPTLIIDVTPEMRLFQEEVFGPVMTVIKVPRDDDATCVEMINNSRFGLGASVYSASQARALRLGRRIRSGMLCINDFGSNYLVQSLPFGGVRDSGFGRFAGIEGLRAMCLERSILTDRFPSLMRTAIPPPLEYPIEKNRGLAFAESLIQFFYDDNWIGKIKGLVGLIRYG